MESFRFKDFLIVVKRSPKKNGRIVYKDAAHVGGPWSDAMRDMNNTSLNKTFRQRLKETAFKVSQ